MCSGIPEGTYDLVIGASFLGSTKTRPREFSTLKFDFKPASISSGASEAYIVQSQNQNENNFQVIVLGEAQKKTIFNGAKKELKGDKDCLLVFNRERKELCLERVSANIQVKKTRDTNTHQRVLSEIERLQRRKHKSSPEAKADEGVAEPDRKERTFSTSSAGDEIDEDDESALEQLMAPAKVEQSLGEEVVQRTPPPRQQQKLEQKTTDEQQQQMPGRESAVIAVKKEEKPPQQPLQQSPHKPQPLPVKKTSSFVRKSILAEDLHLSESSSDDDEEEEHNEEDDAGGEGEMD